MCEAGRIRHHLKHNLWRENSTILFVGYQAVGTLGRMLIEGAKEVKLFGEPIQVAAQIRQLAGASGHADREGLIRWLTGFKTKPEKVFIVHGDDQVCDIFAESIKDMGYEAVAPYSGFVYDLAADVCVQEGKIIPVTQKAEAERPGSVFERLVLAGKRLAAVIQHNKGGANKDLAKFLGQINSLCDKWDR
jgi:metallo-beta-lactamase family protein